MKTKLTLTVERELIRQAKEIAQSRKTSVSSLVETFLANLSLNENQSFSQKWRGTFKQAPQVKQPTLASHRTSTAAEALRR